MRESCQQKMLESKWKNLVICDWDRKRGKYYSIAKFISKNINFNRSLKILIVSKGNHRDSYIKLHDDLEVLTNKVEIVGRGFENILINGEKDNKKYTLANIKITSNIENSRGKKVDYVLCDEYIPSSNELAIFYNCGAKVVYSLGTYNIDYISDKEEIKNPDEWIDSEISKLMIEFSNIPKEENTTKRREIVLGMIMKLESMKPRSLYTTMVSDDCGRRC